jgi:hypothetical protein
VFSRRGNHWTKRVPLIAEALAARRARSAVLDGSIGNRSALRQCRVGAGFGGGIAKRPTMERRAFEQFGASRARA